MQNLAPDRPKCNFKKLVRLHAQRWRWTVQVFFLFILIQATRNTHKKREAKEENINKKCIWEKERMERSALAPGARRTNTRFNPPDRIERKTISHVG